MKISSKRVKSETDVSTLPSMRNLRGAKRKSNFLVMLGALVCAALVSSCSTNDDIEGNNDNGAVRFTAGIAEVATPAGSPVTKAAGTSWGSGDAIGVFMVGHGGTTQVIEANRQFTTTGNGTFTAAAGHEIFFPQTGKVDFIAYYPWKTGYPLGTPIDVEIATAQTAINQPTFDLLWTKADNSGSGYDKVTNASDNVALVFDHKLAKIVMNCTADGSIGSPLTGMTVTIRGMNTQNTFDISTGMLGAILGTAANITPRTITDGSAYDAIIMPGTYLVDVVTVDFTVNGETFPWEVPATTFASGNEYTYAITVTRTGVKFTGTINPWAPVTGDPGTAE